MPTTQTWLRGQWTTQGPSHLHRYRCIDNDSFKNTFDKRCALLSTSHHCCMSFRQSQVAQERILRSCKVQKLASAPFAHVNLGSSDSDQNHPRMFADGAECQTSFKCKLWGNPQSHSSASCVVKKIIKKKCQARYVFFLSLSKYISKYTNVCRLCWCSSHCSLGSYGYIMLCCLVDSGPCIRLTCGTRHVWHCTMLWAMLQQCCSHLKTFMKVYCHNPSFGFLQSHIWCLIVRVQSTPKFTTFFLWKEWYFENRLGGDMLLASLSSVIAFILYLYKMPWHIEA